MEEGEDEKGGMEDSERRSRMEVERSDTEDREKERMQGTRGSNREGNVVVGEAKSDRESRRGGGTVRVSDNSGGKRGREENGSEFREIKRVRRDEKVQTGRIERVCIGSDGKRLDSKDRFKTCVSFVKDKGRVQKVLANTMERPTLGIQSDAVGVVGKPIHVQLSDEDSGGRSEEEGDTVDILRRRLDGHGKNKGRGDKTSTKTGGTNGRTRIHDKYEKIDEGARKESGVSRSESGHHEEQDENTKEESKEFEETSEENSSAEEDNDQRYDESDGEADMGSSSVERTEEEHIRSRMDNERNRNERRSGQGGRHEGRIQEEARENIRSGYEERTERGGLVQETSGSSDHDRRRTKGSSSDTRREREERGRIMEVDKEGERGINELERTYNSMESDKEVEEDDQRENCELGDGFECSRELRQKELRESGEISENSMEDQEDRVREESRNISDSEEGVRNRGSGQAVESGGRGGLLSEGRSISFDQRPVGTTGLGPIRYTILNEGKKLRIERIRPESDGTGRDENGMEKQRIIIRIPAVETNTRNDKESDKRKGKDDNSGTKLNEKQMEPNDGKNSGGRNDTRKSSKRGRKRKEGEDNMEGSDGRWFEMEVVLEKEGVISEDARRLLEESSSMEDRKKKVRVWRNLTKYVEEIGREGISVESVISYLAKRVFIDGASYGVIQGEKSAIMMIVRVATGEDWNNKTLVKLAMQAINRLRPVVPRYVDMWDIRRIYEYYSKGKETRGDKKQRPNIELRTKAFILTRASIAGRGKDVTRIARSTVQFGNEGMSFRLYGWKTQAKERVRSLSNVIEVKSMERKDICAVTAMKEYMTMNETMYRSERGKLHDSVWIHYNRADEVKEQTLAKDTKETMKEMGIDTRIFGPATIRHAAISFWCNMGVSREEVARRTGHRSLNVISFYYDKSVTRDIMAGFEKEITTGEDEESDEDVE